MHEVAGRNDRLISERGFCFSLSLYAALFAAAMTVFGGTLPQTETGVTWKASSAGTLIFGVREQVEISDRYGANHFLYQSHETRRALTFRSHSDFDFASRSNRLISHELVSVRAYDPIIARLPSAPANAPRSNEPAVSSAGDPSIKPREISLPGQGVSVGEEITPISEQPSTWFAVALLGLALSIGWRAGPNPHSATRPRLPLFSRALGLWTALLFSAQVAFGAEAFWTGATGTTWSIPGNWSPGTPALGDNAVFNSTFSNQPNLTDSPSIGGIWMTGSVRQDVTISGSGQIITLSGSTINGTAGLGILVDNSNASTLTINAGLQLDAAQTWANNSGNLLTLGGTVDLNGQALTVDGTGSTTISGAVSNGGAFTKAGSGTLILSAANTYTGATTINNGTLSLDSAGSTTPRLASTSGITVNSGGTLLLANSSGTASTDRINDSATVTLNGGTFDTGGLSEHGASNNTAGSGALTLQSTSIIDMGNGASIVAFANSKLSTWSGTLNIYNWSGTPLTGGGTDQLYFGSDATGLTSSQLLDIQFYSGSGTGAYGAGAIILANGELDPVPEPATWIAAVLALGVVCCKERRRFTRIFARRRGGGSRANWLLPIIGGSFFIGVFSASANLAQVLPEMGDLARWALFSLGNNGLQLSGFTAVEGDVGAAGNGIISMDGNAMIDGNLYYRSNSVLRMRGNATITGARYHNRDSELDNGLGEASSTSDHAFALEPTRSYTNINLSRNQSITLQGAPGETVVLDLKNFTMSGSATFTLQGTTTTNFIINVTKQFSLSGMAKIVLSGGVQWNNVLFNVRGKGADVCLSGSARFQGILTANLRTVRLSGQSRVIGEVMAKKVLLSGSAQIIHPPIVSH